jgi:hypothetical protein
MNTGVCICERHAAHGIASGAKVPPGFSFCPVCENEKLRGLVRAAAFALEGMREHTYHGHFERLQPLITELLSALKDAT